MVVYIDKETDRENYDSIREILQKKGDVMEKFKAIICPRCVHDGDVNFEECNICRCIDGTIKCCEFELKHSINPKKGIEEEKLNKVIDYIANKNRDLASFQRKGT